MIWVKAPQIPYVNEIVELVKVFFPQKQIAAFPDQDPESIDTGMLLEARYEEKAGNTEFAAFLYDNGMQVCNHTNILSEDDVLPHTDEEKKTHRIIKNGIKGCVFDLLNKFTGKHPKWGALTGIRPVKLVQEMYDFGLDESVIRRQLYNIYKLLPEKADLLLQTADNQRPLLDNGENKEVSVYIHIPFCSSRCHYCSFPSDLIHRVSDKMRDYLECLEQELIVVMEALHSRGTIVDTIYIGGGTPTVLDHFHLEKLLKLVKEKIADKNSIREYTIEAGRPDSLDERKLELLKEFGVTRLSINPQSMNQGTLDLIGRNHTVEDIIRVTHQARKLGFDCINMDVILALPGEGPEHMEHTMEQIAALNPENVTVHTLAVKRASAWKYTFDQYDADRQGLAEQMAQVCRKWIERMGMVPYYLYRQKYMLDHLENIGYALPGKECLYNIQFMDEKRDIWAFGAGASSKIYYPDEDRLVRIGNVKDLNTYLSRIEEMIEKKQKVLGMS